MLTNIEKRIILKKEALSNKILYDLCLKYPLGCQEIDGYNKIEALAAQLLLIGRVYAASPQRRSYKKIKVEFSNAANGRDDFFTLLAEKMYENKAFCGEQHDSILSQAKELMNSNYSFLDASLEADLGLLKKSIKCVLGFNDILRKAIISVDKADLDACLNVDRNSVDYSDALINFMSFASKFMHFHCPNTIFIMDNISSANFALHNSVYKFKFAENGENVNGSIEISRKEEKNLMEIFKEQGMLECKYCRHCIKEFLLAKRLFSDIEAEEIKGKSITRFTDNYIMNVVK